MENAQEKDILNDFEEEVSDNPQVQGKKVDENTTLNPTLVLRRSTRLSSKEENENKETKARHTSRDSIRKGNVHKITSSIEKLEKGNRFTHFAFSPRQDVLSSPNLENNKAKARSQLQITINSDDRSAHKRSKVTACESETANANSHIGVNQSAEAIADIKAGTMSEKTQLDVAEEETDEMGDNTQVPDNLTLAQLFLKFNQVIKTNTEINNTLSQLKTEFQSSSLKIDQMHTRLEQMEKQVESNKTEIKEVKEKAIEEKKAVEDKEVKDTERMEAYEQRLRRLEQITINQEVKLDEVKGQADRLQYHSMKCNLIIHGIERKKNENCKQKVTKFFRSVMGIQEDIPLLAAHRMGGNMQSPIIIKLPSTDYKGLIFSHVSNIARLSNSQGYRFRITDQLPGDRAEKSRRNKDILRNNNRLNPPAKLNLKVEKGVVRREVSKDTYVDYTSKIRLPNVIEIMAWNNKKWQQANTFYERIKPGKVITKGSSTFQAFSLEIRSVEDVNQGYTVMRAKHLQARHIVCAFYIPEST